MFVIPTPPKTPLQELKRESPKNRSRTLSISKVPQEATRKTVKDVSKIWEEILAKFGIHKLNDPSIVFVSILDDKWKVLTENVPLGIIDRIVSYQKHNLVPSNSDKALDCFKSSNGKYIGRIEFILPPETKVNASAKSTFDGSIL